MGNEKSVFISTQSNPRNIGLLSSIMDAVAKIVLRSDGCWRKCQAVVILLDMGSLNELLFLWSCAYAPVQNPSLLTR